MFLIIIFNPVNVHWSAYTKPWKWAVMYRCVRSVNFHWSASTKPWKWAVMYRCVRSVNFHWSACTKPWKWAVMYRVRSVNFASVSKIFLLDFGSARPARVTMGLAGWSQGPQNLRGIRPRCIIFSTVIDLFLFLFLFLHMLSYNAL